MGAAGFDPRRFLDRFGHEGHMGAIGLRYVAHEADWVELAIDEIVGPNEAAGQRRLLLGPVTSLVDMAGLLSVWNDSGRQRPVVTSDLRINYLRETITGSTIHARARCHGNTETVVFVEGVVHLGNYDEPVASFLVTYMQVSP